MTSASPWAPCHTVPMSSSSRMPSRGCHQPPVPKACPSQSSRLNWSTGTYPARVASFRRPHLPSSLRGLFSALSPASVGWLLALRRPLLHLPFLEAPLSLSRGLLNDPKALPPRD